jgi:hypothetical protein
MLSINFIFILIIGTLARGSTMDQTVVQRDSETPSQETVGVELREELLVKTGEELTLDCSASQR